MSDCQNEGAKDELVMGYGVPTGVVPAFGRMDLTGASLKGARNLISAKGSGRPLQKPSATGGAGVSLTAAQLSYVEHLLVERRRVLSLDAGKPVSLGDQSLPMAREAVQSCLNQMVAEIEAELAEYGIRIANESPAG